MEKKTSINRREMLRLTSAVAALGAGLGIVLRPGQSWAQPVETSKIKGTNTPWTYMVKFYRQGTDKPVFSWQIPETTAHDILGVEYAGGTGSTLGQINMKFERMSAQTSQTEILGETTLRLPSRATKQLDLPAGSK